MKKILSNNRTLLSISYDLLASLFAWYSAFFLRFNFEIPVEYYSVINTFLLPVLLFQISSLIYFGLYLNTWRFSSLNDFKYIIFGSFSSTIILIALLFMIKTSPSIPRSVLVIDLILLILLSGGARIVYRMFNEKLKYGFLLKKGKPVIILGTSDASINLLRELNKSAEWRVVALLLNDANLDGKKILGVEVFRNFNILANLVNKYNVRHAIVAMPFLAHQDRHDLLNIIKDLNLKVLTVPSVDDLMSGKVNISKIRNIEIEDLLGRDVVNLDDSGLQKLIFRQVVMITGAGGSIGSELCRQVLKFNPSLLICFDISEHAIYKLEQELNVEETNIKFLYAIGDVKNVSRLDNLLAKYQPKIVFHAAAYKHVPLMENINITEAFTNNVLGTYILGQACKKAKVEKFILISSDKAVNPTNVMGASKRLAEMICQGIQGKQGTHFISVRFGNVLGSNGSVVPKFREQILAGGPITITHPEITRYFMSIPEAVRLVMQSALMGAGGEIFVLDMGKQIRIVDLAKDMIRLSGHSEDEIKIKFSGLRPGEKLYEELFLQNETMLPTSHEKLYKISTKKVDEEWVDSLINWIADILDKDELYIKKELKQWVEEYTLDITSS